MSEKTQNSQQTLVIGLVVIAALLAAIVGVLIYQQSTAIPQPTAQPTQTTPTQPTGQTDQTGQTGEPAAFDPKAATKVPKGVEPEAYVQAYYEACDKGDWKKAFDMLPNEKKAGNSPDALEQQVSGYGIKGFKVTGAQVQGDKASVTAEQETAQYGTFVNTWTFVKQGGVWLVESKAVTGMK